MKKPKLENGTLYGDPSFYMMWLPLVLFALVLCVLRRTGTSPFTFKKIVFPLRRGGNSTTTSSPREVEVSNYRILLSQLPDLPNCTWLDCSDNQLQHLLPTTITTLSFPPRIQLSQFLLPTITTLYFGPLKYDFTINQLDLFNKLISLMRAKIVLNKWLKHQRLVMSEKYKPLNMEVLWSPANFTRPYYTQITSSEWSKQRFLTGS